MALYLDIHRHQVDASPNEVEAAHISDLEAQEKHGVKYLKYWYSEEHKTICCLIDAPSKQACISVHQNAHGNLADDIIEVEADMITSFFGENLSSPIGCALNRDGKLDGGFRTICFTDIVSSTKITQKLGDEKAMRLVYKHDELTRAALAAHNGNEIKHTGDGIMASFVSASDSVRFSIELQQSVAHSNLSFDIPFEIRIGMSAGEPVSEDHDLFGAAVQLAARVCDEALPNQILVSHVIHDLCIGKDLIFTLEKEMKFKGFSEEIKTYSVDWIKYKK